MCYLAAAPNNQYAIIYLNVGYCLPRRMNSYDAVSYAFVAFGTSEPMMSRRSAEVIRKETTYIRLSVTLTRLLCKYINLRATCSSRALLTSRTTFRSNIGARRASTRNALTSCAGTRGGRIWRVSTSSNRGLCREIKSSAGVKRSMEVLTVGRRYIRRRVRKTFLVSASD